MRILYVLEYYHPYIGGSEKLFKDLAEGMAEKGHQVAVITSRFSRDLPSKEVVNGVTILRIRARNRFWFTLLAIPKVRSFAKSFDLVHTTTYNAAVPAWIGTRFLGKSVILTFHEVWGKLWFKLPFAKWWEKILYYSFEKFVLSLQFDHYIAVSDYTKEALLTSGIPTNKVTRIYNGIDYATLPSRDKPPGSGLASTGIYFGRLGISKGLDILLESVYLLKQENHDFSLTMVVPKTPTYIWKCVTNLVNDLGILDRVSFYHYLTRDQLYKKLLEHDVVLVPSHSEGFCYSAVEAAGLGIPIIHSGKGALSEVLSSKGIPVLNAESLAESIKTINLSDLHADHFQFHLKTSVDLTVALYKEKGE